MPGVDDKIAIRFSPELVISIRAAFAPFQNLLRQDKHPNPETHDRDGNLVKMTIWLNRPDTLEEEQATRYTNLAYGFAVKLREAGCELLEVSIAEFNIRAA